MLKNYHSHTARCGHAWGTDDEFVCAAIDAGYTVLGFSEHAPWPFADGYREIDYRQRITVEELDEYIDQPVRTYSSGMKARLGFSICVNINPEILIVDEALSVGDKAFQKKCTTKVRSLLKSENITLLFVTHITVTDGLPVLDTTGEVIAGLTVTEHEPEFKVSLR